MTAPATQTAPLSSVQAVQQNSNTNNDIHINMAECLATLMIISQNIEAKINGEIAQFNAKTAEAKKYESYIHGFNQARVSLDDLQADGQYSARGYNESEMQTIAKLDKKDTLSTLSFADFKQHCRYDAEKNLYYPAQSDIKALKDIIIYNNRNAPKKDAELAAKHFHDLLVQGKGTAHSTHGYSEADLVEVARYLVKKGESVDAKIKEIKAHSYRWANNGKYYPYMGYAHTMAQEIGEHTKAAKAARIATGDALLNGWQPVAQKNMLTVESKTDPGYSTRGYTYNEVKTLEGWINETYITKHWHHDAKTGLYHPNMHDAQTLAKQLSGFANDQVSASADLQTQLNADTTNYESIQKFCGSLVSHLSSLLQQIANRL